MPGGQPAQAQQSSIWSATLTVAVDTQITGLPGCLNSAPCSSGLTDDDFTYDGVDYTIQSVYVETGSLNVGVNKAIPAGLKAALTLNVGSSQFALADATLGANGVTVSWSSTGLIWSVGDTVTLSLTGASTTPMTPTNTPAPGTTEYWSGTLTTAAVEHGFGCGFRSGQPSCADQLSDDTVTYHGTDYTIELLHVAYGETLQLTLSSEPKDSDRSTTERSRMALNVGTGIFAKQFLVRDAMISHGAGENNVWTKPDAWVLTWTGSGLSWSENASISLSIVTLPAGGL